MKCIKEIYRQYNRGIWFVIGSLIFLGAFLIAYFNRPLGFAEGQATIAEIETHWRTASDSWDHDVWVEYVYEGVSYRSRLDTYMSSYYVGMVLSVLINPNNPKDVRATGTGWIPYLLIGVFAFLFIFGVYQIVKEYRASKTPPAAPSVEEEDEFAIDESKFGERDYGDE